MLSVSLWAAFASDKIILPYWGNKLGRRYLNRTILKIAINPCAIRDGGQRIKGGANVLAF
ncbi:hypothetical protein HpBHB13_00250 [Helicobacter pylori]